MTDYFEKPIFNHPCTMIMAGPTQSGKSTLTINIIKHHRSMFHPVPPKIIYCYSVWQDKLEQLKLSSPDIEFCNGVPDLDGLSTTCDFLLVLDDLFTDCGKSQAIADLFTKSSHHNKISVLLITQNIFPRDKYSRTISLNAHYMILLKNPRSRDQIEFLARQMYPKCSKFLLESYEDAVESTNYGYLLIDCTQATPQKYRVQTAIFPDDPARIVYEPKN